MAAPLEVDPAAAVVAEAKAAMEAESVPAPVLDHGGGVGFVRGGSGSYVACVMLRATA